jgi:phosphopantothenoylcysteine decarboxylase/phosphopantothenate--cysteine ligase
VEEHPLATDPSGVPPDVLLGVTGGIAAYRACELVRLLMRRGLTVQVAVTRSALRFVGETTFAGLSRRPVLHDRLEAGGPIYPHLDAARVARAVCVAPCSANTLARLALGLADSVLLESCLASTAPLVVAPAMNVRMWEHPATQAHAATLRARGATLVGPEHGELAEGETGAGRLAPPERIAAAVLEALSDDTRTGGSRLAGRRVLVTAGGTREPLDPVRFLGNRSSGPDGRRAGRRGAAPRRPRSRRCSPSSVVRPRGGGRSWRRRRRRRSRPPRASTGRTPTWCLMAAAVADYRPVTTARRQAPAAVRLDARARAHRPDVLAPLGRAAADGPGAVGLRGRRDGPRRRAGPAPSGPKGRRT